MGVERRPEYRGVALYWRSGRIPTVRYSLQRGHASAQGVGNGPLSQIRGEFSARLAWARVSSGPVLQLGHRNAGGALSAHGCWSGSLLVLTQETGQILLCSGRVERIGHGPTKATLEQKVEQAKRTSDKGQEQR